MIKSNLKLKKEEQNDMFNLRDHKPDNIDKNFTAYHSLPCNAMIFLELAASDEAFKLLKDIHDDKELE